MTLTYTGKQKTQATKPGFNLANCSCTLYFFDPSCEVHSV